jgi:hypothetical protein
MPPFGVPGHASYPSGHSTEAHLIALCLEQVMPPEITVPTFTDGTEVLQHDRPLRRIAARIARNREIAGMHFRSDTEVGEKLATKSFEVLLRCGMLGVTDPTARDEGGILAPDALDEAGLIHRARTEWNWA